MSPSRRDLLKATGLLLGALALPTATSQADAGAPETLALSAPSPALHLLKRVAFGPRPGDVERVQQMGLAAYIEEQLNPQAIDDSAMDAMLAPLTTLTMSPDELLAQQPGKASGELVSATILRAVYSRRQLYEVMVDFWTNHFSILIGKGICRQLKTVDDRTVIRPHALGRFEDMLAASTKSPAMLFYLDNVRNTKSVPNENYARELLELHTVGVAGGYTEQDVKEVARCFTGWTIYNSGDERGTFRFVAAQHDDGRKTVMGLPIPPRGGIRDGEQVAQMLARHPSTAMHIAEKLCRRFVSDTPPAALTSRVAAAFSGSSGDIKTTLRALFGSPEFAASTGAKTQRPFELLASAVRALDTHPADTVTPDKMTATLSRQLTQMGQPLFGWQPPNGYPDAAAAWINTSALLARWNYAIALAENRIPEARYDVQDLLPPTARTAGQIVTALARRVLNTQIAPAHYSALVHYLVPKGNAFSTPDPRTLSRRLLELVGLLINSPYFQRR